MTTIIADFPSTWKVPGGYGEVKYGSGRISALSIPLKLLLVGIMTSGTATADQDVVLITSEDDARAAFGAGSQLARMCQAALRIDGVTIYGAPVAAPSGVAAAATITIAGTWTTAGTWNYTIGGLNFTGSMAGTDSATNVAAAIRDAINANTDAPFTATASSGVVTITVRSIGAWGNEYIVHQDTSQLSTGATSTIGGGGSSVTGGGLRFASGTGTEAVTNVLAVILPTEYERIAFAQNDSTNLGRWKTQLNTQAAPIEDKWDQFAVYATTFGFSASQSLAQTTMNHAQFQALWGLNCQSHSSEIAAVFAAMRCAAEQGDPDASYDGQTLPGIVPAKSRADWPTATTQNTALSNSVTPLKFSVTDTILVRSITTRSLNGSVPDYRTLDTSQAVVPAFALRDLLLLWATEFLPAHPRVEDDPPSDLGEPPDGVATPKVWDRVATARLRQMELGDGFPAPIITDVSDNLPQSSFDSVAGRIMTALDVEAAPNQHQIGISVRQRAA